MVIRLGWLGFGPTTFLLTEPADAYSEYGTWSHTSQAKPSKKKQKKKRLPSSCKFHWQCCIRIFSHFGILDGHSLLWWSPVLPVVGACVLAVYIQNLKSLALYPMKSPCSFPLFAVHSASDGKLHWWEQDYSSSTHCESESCSSMITIYCCRGVPYICSCYMH